MDQLYFFDKPLPARPVYGGIACQRNSPKLTQTTEIGDSQS